MSKSLHIIGSRLLGGAESFYMRLIRGLQEAGEQTIAINRPNSLVARELHGIIPQYHAKMSSQWDLFSRMAINKTIKREQPDIVQTYMTRATVLTHIPIEKGPVHIARLGGFYNIKRFRHAHAWIGNTKGICDFLIAGGLPADKVFYIGNFVGDTRPSEEVDIKQLRLTYGIPEEALVIFALGRLVQKKGFDTLVQALAQLPSELQGRPVHLVIAGDGPMAEAWKQQAAALDCGDRIHWAGWQTDASGYFNMADLFVCPSREEPLGNVILEGWAYRKPVVSTATMGGVELITDGQDGLLVPIDDTKAMANALQRCLADEAYRQALAEAGYAKVNAHFTKQAIVSQYQDLYRQLAG